ncbi:MAG: hypothetical protein JWP22_855 [Ramlibacter sp.]|nr:hypothetical protein [Ramlibacter sp.]MDB5912180.1 hypothetical protein [Ramlibacter sp.]
MHRPLAFALALAVLLPAQAQYRGPYGNAPAPSRQQAVPYIPRGAYVVRPQVLNRLDTHPFGRDHVVVFVGPNCPQCEEQLRFVHSYASTRVEVLDVTSGYGADLYAVLRVSGLPATVAGSQVLLGADQNGTQQVLGGAGMRENNSSAP